MAQTKESARGSARRFDLLRARQACRAAAAFFEERPALKCLAISFAFALLIEILHRHSVAGALGFFVMTPHIFLCNWAILMLAVSLSLFFPIRGFVLLIVGVLFVGLGLANGVVLLFRITPLSAIDITVIPSVLTMIDKYLSLPQMLMIGVCLAVLLFFIVRTAIKAKRSRVNFKKAALTAALSALAAAALITGCRRAGAITDDFANLPAAYREYGFTYSFCVSLFDRGIDRPANYEPQVVNEILGEIGEDGALPTPVPEKAPFTPNVVFLQLESFMDPRRLTKLELSAEATPFFDRLKNDYPSGSLTVPYMGSGTINTEFEVLTGMSLDYFGAGEYPYKTVLQSTACETVCRNLAELGYRSHALHNNTATFYDRNGVFPNLGFDSFTSVEYMDGVEYNALGWAKDSVLTNEIIKALDSTEERDFEFVISVQPHGNYPDDLPEGEYPISVGGETGKESLAAYTYYINQLHEVDSFLAELTAAVSKRGEPTVIVIYGDHLPALNIREDDLAEGDLFLSEYVIWSNFGLEAPDRDLYAYQLSAHVMELLGFDNGVLTKLHQSSRDADDYQQALELLEYDMLYGDRAVYDGVEPFEPTAMTMGVSEIAISSVSAAGGHTYLTGTGFTPFSVVIVDGDRVDSVFVNECTLSLEEGLVLAPGTAVSVWQETSVGIKLSKSEPFIIP